MRLKELVFTPKPKDVNELGAGEIGFIITGIKNLSETKVGDTICDLLKPLKEALPDLNLVSQLYSAACFQSIVPNIKS